MRLLVARVLCCCCFRFVNGVPKLDADTIEAIDLVEEIGLELGHCFLQQPGMLTFLNNHAVYHGEQQHYHHHPAGPIEAHHPLKLADGASRCPASLWSRVSDRGEPRTCVRQGAPPGSTTTPRPLATA